MTNILGPYYSPWHWRGEDETYMRELDSAWANIHQPTARAIETVQRNAPNARIMLRSWDIDDHNGDRKREMYADPKGAARKHLEMWKAKWDEIITEMHRNGWTADENRWYLGLINEPDPSYVRQVVEYSLEAMQLVRGTSIRLGVVASSVGTFQKPSEGDNGWTQCIPLEKPINDGGHILLVHEYWRSGGPNYGEDGGNLAWRHHSIPLDVPILIREAGANGYIYQEHSKDDDSGWQKIVAEPKAETYAAQVKEYIEGCDQRVKGVLLYMLDFHSKQWQSFDTQPAMHQLLAIKDARPQVPSPFAATTPPIDTRLPTIIAPGPTPPQSATFYVAVRDGANLRAAPSVDAAKLTAAAYGQNLTVISATPNRDWLQVAWDGQTGWVLAALLSVEPPPPPPAPGGPTPPVPTGIIDPMTALAFLQVESANAAFRDGLLVIRFEVHVFKTELRNDALFDMHFKFTPRNYADQWWRPAPNADWINAHGPMPERHKLLAFARGLNDTAALRSTGMGSAQVMGSNAARIGYATPQAMFNAFRHARYGVNAQVLGFVNYVLSDPALLDALRRRDWFTSVQKYNGLGQESTYVPLLEKALAQIRQEIGG